MTSRIAATAMSLNNDGISSLELGNYEAAASSFSRGLSMVKQALSSDVWKNSSSAALQQPPASSQDAPACQFCKLQADDCAGTREDENETDFLSEGGFVFKEPIMVLPQSVESSPTYSFFVKLSCIQL